MCRSAWRQLVDKHGINGKTSFLIIKQHGSFEDIKSYISFFTKMPQPEPVHNYLPYGKQQNSLRISRY